jgi:hypothetical protein
VPVARTGFGVGEGVVLWSVPRVGSH